MDPLSTLVELWKDHWQKILTPLVSLAIGWYFGTRRAQRNFAKREFYDRLNVSLDRPSCQSLIRPDVEKTILLEKRGDPRRRKR